MEQAEFTEDDVRLQLGPRLGPQLGAQPGPQPGPPAEEQPGPERDPQLDPRLVELPDNVYGTLIGAPSPADTMLRLRRLGWSVRNASWLELACARAWSELLLAPGEEDELAVSGVVDPDRLDDLAGSLAAAGLTGHLELYAADGRLTHTVPVTPPGPPAA